MQEWQIRTSIQEEGAAHRSSIDRLTSELEQGAFIMPPNGASGSPPGAPQNPSSWAAILFLREKSPLVRSWELAWLRCPQGALFWACMALLMYNSLSTKGDDPCRERGRHYVSPPFLIPPAYSRNRRHHA